MPRPVNENGLALSCSDCGQRFEHACDLNHVSFLILANPSYFDVI